MVTFRWLPVAALPLLALGPVMAGTADAASCKVMTVGYAFSSGKVIAIQPDHQDIAFEGCVQFTNNVDFNVTIIVEGGYSVTLGPKESTAPKDAYVGRTAGRHDVTARSGPSSVDGSITVAAAPKPSRSRSPERTPSTTARPATPKQHHPAPKSPRPSSTATGPRLAPKPPTVGAFAPRSHRPSPPGPPPSVAPTTAAPATAAPVPSPSPTGAVLSFPIEPASGRGAGLPGAVAAMAVVGTAAGLVRVLLAEPVDPVDERRRTVGGAS